MLNLSLLRPPDKMNLWVINIQTQAESDLVMEKLEELGWLIAYRYKPTSVAYLRSEYWLHLKEGNLTIKVKPEYGYSILDLHTLPAEKFEALPAVVPADLKSLNMDGREKCASCHSFLKEPYPGLRHCPRCEP